MLKCHCGNTKLVDYSENYYVCDECKTLVSKHSFDDTISRVEDESKDLYGDNYWKKVMLEETGLSSINELIDFYLKERVIYWIKNLLEYIPLGSNVAEVGCGLGQLAYMMQMLGYDTTAYELSPSVCKYVEETLKVNMICSEFGKDDAKYKAILAFDVFEHLLEPKSFLEACSTHLKEQGIVCMQTPCYDPSLSYQQMCKEKPRFKNLMVEEQHIYLYSREAVTRLLNQYGFTYISFVPAFFGDDYDMFLIASKEPINKNTEEEIDEYLNSVPAGRLVKAVIALFNEKTDAQQRFLEADNDRNVRLESIRTLEAELEKSETESLARFAQITELGDLLETSERDRAARGEQVEILTQSVKDLEKDGTSLRMQMEQLNDLLKESEADRDARAVQIEQLSEMLKESEADRAARLEQINQLAEMLKESEADRAARLEQINQLAEMLKESEADRAARLEQISTLTEMLQGQKQEEEIQ